MTKLNRTIEIEEGRDPLIKVHKVTEEELIILEKGEHSTLFLNVAIGLLSIGISFIYNYTTLPNDASAHAIGIAFAFILFGIVGGFISLFVWWRTDRSLKKTLADIRARIEQSKE